MVAIFPQLLRIGVIYEAVQMADIVGVDVFGSISTDYADWMSEYVPLAGVLKPFMIPVEWHYISSSLEPAYTSAGVKIKPTETYDTAPRDLDIVIIGGPLPNFRPAAADRFFRESWNSTRTWMTTCVGAMWLASSGVMDGHKATTNRMFLPMAKLFHPNVNWQYKRWQIEEKPYSGKKGGKGELWTSGGAQAGLDMIATYALQKFDNRLVTKVVLEGLDIDPSARGQYY